MNIVLSVVFVLIIAAAIWGGYKRGLILGVANLVAVVASLYLACLLSAAFSNELVTVLKPFAEGYMERQIEAVAMPELGLDGAQISVADALEQNPDLTGDFCVATFRAVGIYGGPAEQMAQEAQEYAEVQRVDLTAAMTQVFCERIAYVGCIILGFILILILLLAIGNLPNLTFKIPEREKLNDVGGVVMGVVNGVTYCVLLCWALQFFGLVIGRDTLTHTFLAKVFLFIDFITLGVGI